MSALTSLVRIWLTRSFSTFVFTGDCDETLAYDGIRDLGLYVHIPFCRSICGFCPYCKRPYEAELMDRYIDSLLEEIRMVGRMRSADGKTRGADGKTQDADAKTRGSAGKMPAGSLYFGGGSPALASGRIGEIIAELKKYFDIRGGIGVELHPSDAEPRTLDLLEEAGVDRVSIGIQSFQDKYVDILGRKGCDPEAIAAELSGRSFSTVSMDLIFALPGQTGEDIRADIDTAFASGANHAAIYPFIDFDHTPGKIPAMKREEKRRLLRAVCAHAREKGLSRDSIWTFASDKGAGYSSMTRDDYLGFGCSAVTLLPGSFKINTFDVESYIGRISSGRLPSSLTIRFTERQRMVYWLFWRLYGMSFDEADFREFFGKDLEREFGLEFWAARRLGLAEKEGSRWKLTEDGAFWYHHFENYYTLSYIDKMWGLMKDEPFPGRMTLR